MEAFSEKQPKGLQRLENECENAGKKAHEAQKEQKRDFT